MTRILNPLNMQRIKLAEDIDSAATTVKTIGRFYNTKDGTDVIGKQYATMGPWGDNAEITFLDLSSSGPTLIEDRSAQGLESIYQYGISTRGVVPGNKNISSPTTSADFKKSHAYGDYFILGISAENFIEILDRFDTNVANKVMEFDMFDRTTVVSTGKRNSFIVPHTYDGNDLVRPYAKVIGTAGTTGDTTIQFHNETTGEDMLSTPITIASGTTEGTGVVDVAHSTVSYKDEIVADVKTVSTTEPIGLISLGAFE